MVKQLKRVKEWKVGQQTCLKRRLSCIIPESSNSAGMTYNSSTSTFEQNFSQSGPHEIRSRKGVNVSRSPPGSSRGFG
jgi:hypothetical protein